MLAGFCSVSFQGRNQTLAPENLSRARNAGLSLQQCLLCAGGVMLPQLQQREQQIVLVVVWIAGDGITVDFFNPGAVTQVCVDMSQRRQIGILFAALLGTLPGRIECLRVLTFSEVSIGEVEYFFVRGCVRLQFIAE